MTKKRFVVLAALVTVLGALAAKMSTQRRAEWHGLTESEARSKIDAKLPKKIPEEKRGMISDQIITKMRERGVLGDEDAAVGDETAADDGAADVDAAEAAAEQTTT